MGLEGISPFLRFFCAFLRFLGENLLFLGGNLPFLALFSEQGANNWHLLENWGISLRGPTPSAPTPLRTSRRNYAM